MRCTSRITAPAVASRSCASSVRRDMRSSQSRFISSRPSPLPVSPPPRISYSLAPPQRINATLRSVPLFFPSTSQSLSSPIARFSPPARSFHSTPSPQFLDTMLGSFTGRLKKIWSGDGKAPAQPTEAKPAAPAAEAQPAAEGETPSLDSLLARSRSEKERDPETVKDESELKSVEEKIFARGTMDLEDYRTQLSKSTKIASKAKLLKYIPGTSQYTEALQAMEKDMEGIKQELALLDAMTDEERKKPALLLEHGFKRKQRIAAAANATVADVNKSLERFVFMREIMSIVSRFKKEGKPIPEDPKELGKWAREHPEVLKRLKKVAPSGMGNGAQQLKSFSRFANPNIKMPQ